ncbi:hypothetical protein SOVF_087610 [Spinacia oleracea]|nr:hypothetical protein SOVF_087610 [Spinacia oleracea]
MAKSPSRMGIIIPYSNHDTPPLSEKYLLSVVGRVVDYRSFSESQIQLWVTQFWSTNGPIEVQKALQLKDTFFFFCNNIEDRDNLLNVGTASFKGALFVFKGWSIGASISTIDFNEAYFWIKVEGIPTPENELHVARRALERIGRVLKVDENSRSEGLKNHIRAKLIIQIEKVIVPGYYYEYRPDHYKWVYFRYEGIFNFCQNCGKVGHRRPHCRVPENQGKAEIESRLKGICGLNFDFMAEQPNPPLYTKRIMGLEDVERFRTSRVQLRNPHGNRQDRDPPSPPKDDSSDDNSDTSSKNSFNPGRSPPSQNRKGKRIRLWEDEGSSSPRRKRSRPAHVGDSNHHRLTLLQRRGIQTPLDVSIPARNMISDDDYVSLIPVGGPPYRKILFSHLSAPNGK